LILCDHFYIMFTYRFCRKAYVC